MEVVCSGIAKSHLFVYYSSGSEGLTGTLTLSKSTVSGNSTTGLGGGIDNGGTLTLSNSAISGNTTTSGNGSGIFNNDTLTLSNSTISENTASSFGGGIFIQSRVVARGTLIAHVDFTFSTMYGNTAHGGGDIAIEDFGSSSNGNSNIIKQASQVKISNSIVAGDPAHPGLDIMGMLTSYGYNLFQDISGATFDLATRTQHSTDKTLSVNDSTKLFADPVRLRDNGDPNKTLTLAPDSLAVNQIPLAACHVNGTTTDQRGMERPDGNETACDIGAYEYVDSPSGSRRGFVVRSRPAHRHAEIRRCAG